MIENYNIKTIQWPMPYPLVMTNKFLNFWYHMGNLFSSSNGAKADFFKAKVRTELNRYKISFQVSLSSLSRYLGLKSNLNFPHVKIDEVYDKALTHYTPQPYEGAIVLFGASKRLAGFRDPLYGWGDVATKGVEIFELPVNPHGSLVEPYVGILAKKLEEALDNVTNPARDVG